MLYLYPLFGISYLKSHKVYENGTPVELAYFMHLVWNGE